MQVTGINDIDTIVNVIIQGQQQTGSLKKNGEDLSKEIQNFETQIFEMQSEIDKNLSEGGLDSRKTRRLKDLEAKVNKTKKELI